MLKPTKTDTIENPKTFIKKYSFVASVKLFGLSMPV